MPVKLRLARHGRKKRPYYHIVVADARAPRDGKFIEQIGYYNPTTVPADIQVDGDKAYEWLMKGAQPTHTVRAILRFSGVLYRKHLQRGVSKGAMTQEVADMKLREWMDAKTSKVQARKDTIAKAAASAVSDRNAVEKKQRMDKAALRVDEPKAEDAPAAADVPAAEAPAVEEAPKAEQPKAEAPKAEEPKAEEPKAEEPKAEEPKTEAPKAEEVAAVAAAPVVAAAVNEASGKADDLTKIEGVGPKIGEVLAGAGFKSFSDLAAGDVEKIKEVLAENKLASHDPTTWPQQAKLAADGKWDELKTLQDELDGGKVA